ncbi:hypothetical protein E2562_033585 [Oryza meyeriana var. granulata]|uniref:Uncharacterized protein n=1 Tax=Oryza meyeriana var. granulata TaxID=110450 RepID=A0A6G1E6J1_9ORYZ|nr:hypothetical protein E2562_033585 [Oryza meyeriana var. granulata]
MATRRCGGPQATVRGGKQQDVAANDEDEDEWPPLRWRQLPFKKVVKSVVDAVVGGGGPEQVAAMVQKSRGWSGFISEVLEVVLKVSAVFNLWEVTSGSSCESNVGVVLISTLSTALRQNCDVSGSRQNRPAGKSNARGKGDLIPSIDRPARLVSLGIF